MVLNWCLENQCGVYLISCNGTTHPALCPLVDIDEDD
jgi:hypothetical protein